MKNANKIMLTALLTAALLMSATGCSKKTTKTKGETKRAEVTSEQTSEVNGTEVLVARKAPDLAGHPDKTRISESGVMPSSEAAKPVITDLRSAYSVINYEMYSKIVSGSEFTVEAIISDEYETTAPQEITMYVFAYDAAYEWNTEDAYATIKGSPINAIVDQEYNTIHTYWIKGMLPKEMPTGKYTMVFVLPDGTVDSMADFDLVQPSEAPAPMSID